MASAASPSAFPLHRDACLLDEHDRVLFQHSHAAGTHTQCATLQEGLEGLSPSISEEIQRESYPVYLDQRAGTLPAHYRSNQAVPGRPSQATKTTEGQSQY